MLAVDKRIILLSVLVGVGEGYLYIFPLEVYDGVEGFFGYVLAQKVKQTVARMVALAVVYD